MVGGKIFELTDGSRLEVKVNFATLYYMQKSKLDKLMKRIDEKGKESEDPENYEPDEDDAMEASALMIYCILRSNGRTVTKEEAMELVPMDTDMMKDLFTEWTDRLNDYKKKEDAKKMRMPS